MLTTRRNAIFLSAIAYLFMFWGASELNAQKVLMQDATINQCGGSFFDPGDSTSNYADLDSLVLSWCPNPPGSSIRFDFQQFQLLPGDRLCVYDGNSIAAPLIGCFNRNNPIPGNLLQASINAAGGCLSFQFVSDNSLNSFGWEATVSCDTNRCQTIIPQIDSINGQTGAISDTVFLCLGDSLRLVASGSYPDNNILYNQTDASSSFDWSFGDGSQLFNGGTSVGHLYDRAGAYWLDLVIMDQKSCSSGQTVRKKIVVLPPLDLTSIKMSADRICPNDSVWITGYPEASTLYLNESLKSGNGFLISDMLFNPDAFGCIDVSSYLNSETVVDPSQIEIFMQLEHGYAGDLVIWLTTPGGDSIQLMNRDARFNTMNFDSTNTIRWRMDAQQTLASWFQTNLAVCNPVVNNTCSFDDGAYLPDSSFTRLTGEDLNGSWCLHFNDNGSGNDGFLASWGISFGSNGSALRDSFVQQIDSVIWDTSSFFVQVASDSLFYTNPTPGDYSLNLLVKDNNGCGVGAIFNVEILDIQLNAMPDTSICLDQDTIQLVAAVGGTDTVFRKLNCGSLGLSCSSQDTGIIGLSGSVPNSNISPFRGNWHDGRIQIVYTASELRAAGINNGTIDGLGLYVDQVLSTQPYNNFTIKMGCTSLSEPGNSFVPGLQVVRNSVAYTPTAGGLNYFPFDQTYDWDEQSNVIVEFCFDNTSPGADDVILAFPSLLGGTSVAVADNQTGCVLTSSTVNFFTSNDRPAIMFTSCPAKIPDVSYLWTPTLGLDNDTAAAPFANPDTTTNYRVTVTFGNLCVLEDSIELVVNGFEFTVNPQDTIICELDQAQLTATGGDFALWQPGATLDDSTSFTPIANPTDTATYTVQLSDSAGCTYFDTVSVGRNTFFRIDIGVDDTICFHDSLLIEPSESFLNYNWSNGNSTDSFIYASDTGLYYGVFDNGDCDFFSDTIRISHFPIVEPQISISDSIVCAGDTIVAIVESGSNNVIWNNDASITSDTLRLTTGNSVFYSAIDNFGCRISSDTVSIRFNALPDASISISPFSGDCENQSVSLLANGYDSRFIMTWSNGGKQLDSVVVFTAGTYSLIVVDTNGCTDTGFIQVNLNPIPTIEINAADTTICCTTPLELSATISSGIVYWFDSVPGENLFFYDTGIVWAVAIDSNGCKSNPDSIRLDKYCFENFGIIAASDTLEIGLNADLGLPFDDPFQFETPSWEPAALFQDNTGFSLTSLPLDSTVSFNVNIMHRESGCQTSREKTIVVINESRFIFPNIFTPNGDGLNDEFTPNLNGAFNLSSLKVFDRLGNLVHNGTNGWNGKLLDGTECPTGTYVYEAVMSRPSREPKRVTGVVVLLR